MKFLKKKIALFPFFLILCYSIVTTSIPIKETIHETPPPIKETVEQTLRRQQQIIQDQAEQIRKGKKKLENDGAATIELEEQLARLRRERTNIVSSLDFHPQQNKTGLPPQQSDRFVEVENVKNVQKSDPNSIVQGNLSKAEISKRLHAIHTLLLSENGAETKVEKSADFPRFVHVQETPQSAMRKARKRKKYEMGSCIVCLYVLGRLRDGFMKQLPSICNEIWSASNDKFYDYPWCHMVIGSFSQFGASIKNWIDNGCYKSEPYGAIELIKPCPDQAICSELRDLQDNQFCWSPGSDFEDENLKKERKWTSEGGNISATESKELGIPKGGTWSGHHHGGPLETST
eukprot:g1059.t1